MIGYKLSYWISKAAFAFPPIAAVIASPLIVVGAAETTIKPGACPESLVAIIRNIANFGGGFIIVVAVIVFLISAYYFLFGAGSEDAAKKGRQFLVFGVVGIIIGLLAINLPTIIRAITGLDPGAACPQL